MGEFEEFELHTANTLFVEEFAVGVTESKADHALRPCDRPALAMGFSYSTGTCDGCTHIAHLLASWREMARLEGHLRGLRAAMPAHLQDQWQAEADLVARLDGENWSSDRTRPPS